MDNTTKYGIDALDKNTGSNNTALGAYSAYNNVDGSNNTAVGSNSAFFNELGANNTSLGCGSLCNNVNGSLNTAIGSSALEGVYGQSVGNENTAVGVQSLYAMQNGEFNSAVGAYAGLNVTDGAYNTFLGANTSAPTTNCNNSTAIGYNAVITESNQMMLGGLDASGQYPNVVVPGTMNVLNESIFNTDILVNGLTVGLGGGSKTANLAVGIAALSNNSTGNQNIAIGRNALSNNVTGGNNIAIGVGSLQGTSTSYSGSNNVGIGAGTLQLITTGINNVAIGEVALLNNTTGSYNVAIGQNAASNLNCIGNTAIGYSANGSNTYTSYNYSTAIGYMAQNTASNQIMLGGLNNSEQYPSVIIPGQGYLSNFTATNNETQLVPKSYVDSLAGGLSITQSCICATTANITLTSSDSLPPSSSTDGVTLADITDPSYNVLVMAQTNSVENGVYSITYSDGLYTWIRPPSDEPMCVGYNAAGAYSFIKGGDTYACSGLVQTNADASGNSIVGTDALNYSIYYQISISSGQGLNTSESNGKAYLNVDSSLNFINYIDSTLGQLMATGVLSIGEYTTTSVNIGSSVTNVPVIIKSSMLQGVDATFNTLSVSGINIGLGGGQVAGNTAVGNSALYYTDASGICNTAVGFESLNKNTSGNSNTTIGYQAGYNNTTGSYNCAIGVSALLNNQTGGGNVAIGRTALQSCTASNNTAIGTNVLRSTTTGVNNVSIGENSLTVNTTGSYNTAIGSNALNDASNNAGSYNTAIGYNAGLLNVNLSNSTAIGYNAQNTESNQIMLGGLNSSSQYPSVFIPGSLSGSTGTFTTLSATTATFTNMTYTSASYTEDITVSGINIGIGGGSVASNARMGYQSLYSNTTGYHNDAFGYQALYSNLTGNDNTAMGYESLYLNDSSCNTAIGYKSLYSNTTGLYNTAIGCSAGELNAADLSYVTAIGYNALNTESNQIMLGGVNGSGNYPTVVIPGSLACQNVSFSNLTLESLYSTDASFSTVTATTLNVTNLSFSDLTLQSLYSTDASFSTVAATTMEVTNMNVTDASFANIYATTATFANMSYQTATFTEDITINGVNAGRGSGDIVENTVFGYGSLRSIDSVDASWNSAFGYYVLTNNTTGNANSAFGFNSLVFNTTGCNNVACGTQSLYSNITGGTNVAVGNGALLQNVAGNCNTAIGDAAMYNIGGSWNTSLGYQALLANDGSANPVSYNTAIGCWSLYNTTSGSFNTGVGVNALQSVTSGSYNSALGYNAGYSSLGQTADYSTAIGYNAQYTASNQIMLGGANPSNNYPLVIAPGGYNTTSDYRIKQNIVPLKETTFSVDDLNPVHYLNTNTGKQDIGVIAHELQEHYPFLVNGEKDDSTGMQSVNYTGLIGLLIHEIQILKQQVKQLNNNNNNI